MTGLHITRGDGLPAASAEEGFRDEKTTLVGFRLENELLKRIDAYGKHLEQETPDLKLARVDVVRVLLLRALAQVEEPEPSGKKRA